MHLISHSNVKLQNNIICFSTNRDLQSVSIPAAPMKEKHSAPALLSSPLRLCISARTPSCFCAQLVYCTDTDTSKTKHPTKKPNRKSTAKKLAKQTETMFLMMEARYKCCLNPVRPSCNCVFTTCGKALNNETLLVK